MHIIYKEMCKYLKQRFLRGSWTIEIAQGMRNLNYTNYISVLG